MKDNWTKAFQEKLGEYELEMPEPAAAGRRTGRILPLLLAGAAAAALLLLVLLRTPEQTQPAPHSRLIAEAQPTLDAPVLNALAPVTLLPERHHWVASEQSTVEQQPVEQQPVEQVSTLPEPEPEPATVEPVAASEKEEVVTDWTESWPEEPSSRQRIHISGRVHVDPSLLRSRAVTQEPVPQLVAEYFIGASTLEDMPPVSAYNTTNTSNNTDAHNPMNFVENGEVRCDLPVKAGVAIQWDGPSRFSFGTGLDYAFHRSRISYPRESEWEYRMHYIGLPLRGLFTLVDAKRLNWYAAAGGEVEWMVGGRLYKRDAQQKESVEAIDRHPFLFSLTAATGLELKLSELVGLYAEPGIAWHPKQKGDLPDYYREHPLSFDLRVGVRFDL